MMASESYLYLAEIVGVGVKVGITNNPERRLVSHARDAEAYGRAIGRTWVSSVPHVNARANESAIKCGNRREYLARSFEECVAHAQSLPMERATDDDGAGPLTAFLVSLYPAYGKWLGEQAPK